MATIKTNLDNRFAWCLGSGENYKMERKEINDYCDCSLESATGGSPRRWGNRWQEESQKILAMISREYLGILIVSLPPAVSYIDTISPLQKKPVCPSSNSLSHFPHTFSVLPMNSFKPLSKRFSFPSLQSSHPHTQFPSATAILNTADTFRCFPIVVVQHPSCSIS